MKKVLFVLAAALCLSIAVISLQYFSEDTLALIDVRGQVNAQLFTTSEGMTRYKVYGDTNEKTLVLIHSFNGFIESWDPNIDALVDAGYRVIAYDLFGRGLSDRPRVNYDLPLFREQLAQLLNHLDVKEAALVGSSFGCVIASDFANKFPDKVSELVLVGPAGWPSDDGRNPIIDIPILGNLVFHYFGQNILEPKVEAYLFDLSNHKGIVDQWRDFASLDGFYRASHSTLKHAPVLDYTSGWQQLGALKKPTLFIWGKEDVSFPYLNTEKVKDLVPNAKIVGVDNAAHWVNIEQAKKVNTEIIGFLASTNN